MEVAHQYYSKKIEHVQSHSGLFHNLAARKNVLQIPDKHQLEKNNRINIGLALFSLYS
jgi:hypothetical protein